MRRLLPPWGKIRELAVEVSQAELEEVLEREGAGGDPDVLAKTPFFKIMLNVFNNAVTRPSTVAGADYNQLSTAFFQNVNNVLTGAESGKDAVLQVEQVAKRIVH